MGLHGFFFPPVRSGTTHETLAIRRNQLMESVRRKWAVIKVGDRVARLESDLGYVTLVLGALLETLDARGVVTKADVKAAVSALDDVDGVRDGRLDIRVLRDL